MHRVRGLDRHAACRHTAWWATVVLLGTLLSNQDAAGEDRPARPDSASVSGQASGDDGLVRERPWVGVVFFYWYTWDYDRQLGSWAGQGVHNTPLYGYYDSRTYRDNYRSLRLASEWGVTHHWMDYWAPTWKGEGGEMREKIVMRAAEDVRKAGYNIWMSYYQDGNNFEMTDFVKNVREKRDVHQWLRDFGRSPIWPRAKAMLCLARPWSSFRRALIRGSTASGLASSPNAPAVRQRT